ncbi:hypothetical protein D3C85_1861800 [compost metagenome]
MNLFRCSNKFFKLRKVEAFDGIFSGYSNGYAHEAELLYFLLIDRTGHNIAHFEGNALFREQLFYLIAVAAA